MNYDMDTKEGMDNCIAWQQRTVDLLGEGGLWAVPRSFAIYIVYPSKMHAYRLDNQSDVDVDRVFKAMAWTVSDQL